MQALQRAYNDGNDVITLSLGVNSGMLTEMERPRRELNTACRTGWTEELLGVVASRLAAQGKVIVAAAGMSAVNEWHRLEVLKVVQITIGNFAQYGGFCPSSPGVGLGVIDVGSIET